MGSNQSVEGAKQSIEGGVKQTKAVLQKTGGKIAKAYKFTKLSAGMLKTYFSKADQVQKGAHLLAHRVELEDPIDVACAVISSWVYDHGQTVVSIKEHPEGVVPFWLKEKKMNSRGSCADGLIQDGSTCPVIDQGKYDTDEGQVDGVQLRYLGRAVFVLKKDVAIRDRPSADKAEAKKELRRLFMERGLTAIPGAEKSDGPDLEIEDATFLSAGPLSNGLAAIKIKHKTQKYYIIAWQGTDFAKRPMDLITDMSAAAVSTALWNDQYPELQVHAGMAARIQGDKCDYLGLMIMQMREFFGQDPGTVVFTGHSLGGGCALVAHMVALGDEAVRAQLAQFKDLKVRSVVFAAPSPFFSHAKPKTLQAEITDKEDAATKEVLAKQGAVVRLKEACPKLGITNDHVGIVQKVDGTQVTAAFHYCLVPWTGTPDELADGNEDTEKMRSLKSEFRSTSKNYVCDKDIVPRLPAHIDWAKPMLQPVLRETIFGDKKPTDSVMQFFNETAEHFIDAFTDIGAWRNTKEALLNYFHMSTIEYHAFTKVEAESECQWELQEGVNIAHLNDGITLPKHEAGDDFIYLGSCHTFFPTVIRFAGKPDNWYHLTEEETTKKAHELLDAVRNFGHQDDDGVWEKVYDSLRLWPKTMERPAPRRYSLLHQAIHWGNERMVRRLLDEFGADLHEKAIGDNGAELTILQVWEKAMTERGLNILTQHTEAENKAIENMSSLYMYLHGRLHE